MDDLPGELSSYPRSDFPSGYHLSSGLSPRCVLGKWVCLVTHAMSLFDLQDVYMVIGSLATLDLPMVADLIRIFVLKGPYCTLTMTDWFLQVLSVIPRGSWGDVARRFTMIRWVSPKMWFRSHKCCEPTASYRSDLIVDRDYDGATVMDLKPMFILGLELVQAHGKSINRGPGQKAHQLILPLLSSPAAAAVAACRRRRRHLWKSHSDRFGEEIPSVKSSSSFLVQTGKGIGIPIVDRIRRPKPPTVEVSISS
ncbi:hypothetical protein F511_41485 [Dorcoceras hygrometricum]|uniref:Uncharacterized protein n=1 Tax=Dorcoceras hygrometricum TaxID=472368 RepID=A0A2Z7AF69_9LAMI|nr:hypothetical protein F511_41485 [Dorcoceras hygrometricum]